MAGKGSDYRPVNKKKFDENFDRIFGKKDDPSKTLKKKTEKDKADER